ncbi:hypothetical protein I545_6136 [Mycobacterium kansasii 662]|uniref:Uncharacterized protein n=1 Tax=Mycobacterium kansasii 662 TaxID=1299326 RepID=X7YRR1_MYCKA|nr:hypothetical protein I545_6136 [Mycobacterium kansasii 662]KEP41560.1 hypothetical protein MKSMC1_33330 [Mycobacterium kansasii]
MNFRGHPAFPQVRRRRRPAGRSPDDVVALPVDPKTGS